jgi:hypothetical protein
MEASLNSGAQDDHQRDSLLKEIALYRGRSSSWSESKISTMP